jgi:hypothetical protein
MRYDRAEATDDWSLLEVVDRGRCLCSDEFLEANDEELARVFGELRLLRAAGCPPDETKGSPEIGKVTGKCKGEHAKSTFYVLKAKPTGWRLYFMIQSREQREVVFLYAVCKKEDRRDPEDFHRCCRIFKKLESGRCRLAALELPDR